MAQAHALAAILALGASFGLAACSDSPATQAGMAVDQAGRDTRSAVGTAADRTGAALDRAGTSVRNTVDPNHPATP